MILQNYKTLFMRQIVYVLMIASSVLLFSACGSSRKEDNAALGDKKARLEKIKKEKGDLDNEIKKLEQEITKANPSAQNDRAKLVAVSTVLQQDFTHYIELQGNVTSDNVSYISPRMGPAQVKAIYVKEGNFVKKGQLLMKLDDAILRQGVATAKKQVESLKTQLGFAKNIYERQKNLWEQGIGTEVQLLTAKNTVEGLEKALAVAQEGVRTANEQLNTSNVYSDVNGLVEKVNIKVGETFTGMVGNGIPQIQIVNNSSLKVVINVPENYSSKVRLGSSVEVEVPDAGKKYTSAINVSGQFVDPNSRSFNAEVKIPGGGNVRANQSAKVRIMDYSAPNAVTVPINVVQTDEKGKYVYVMVKEGNRTVARKKTINVGETYNGMVEVRAGLGVGEQIITEGYQVVYDGQLITTI
jgi:membrane fusion protein, multidrug efflux system